MKLKFAKSGLDLISISRITRYCNESPCLIWPTLWNVNVTITSVSYFALILNVVNLIKNLERENIKIALKFVKKIGYEIYANFILHLYGYF